MSIESTLEKVELDIAAGDLGLARERLHGLIASYPYQLDLRERLAEVYWQLQYPAMAGRYWYLANDDLPHRRQACARFEAVCGQDPLQILQALKFRGSLEEVSDPYARQKLQELQQQVKMRYNQEFEFTRRGRPNYRTVPGGFRYGRLILAGCLIILVLILGLAVFGLFNLLTLVI